MTPEELQTQGDPKDAQGWFSRGYGNLDDFATKSQVDLSFAIEDRVVTVKFVLESTSTTQSGTSGPNGSSWQTDEDRVFVVEDAPEWKAYMAGDQFKATRHTSDGAIASMYGPHPRLDLAGDYLRITLLTCEQWVGPGDSCKPS